MKRMGQFYMTRHKETNDLVKQIETIQVENQRSKLKKIITQRKDKWKQFMGNVQLKHPKFNHLKRDYSEFSNIMPIAPGQPFLNQNSKMRLLNSDRAFSSSPNMKVGNAEKIYRNKSQTQDSVVLNQKFMQYDRIIDEQSAQRKIQALDNLKENLIVPSKKNSSLMKKTYFQKFLPDKYNFYRANEYSSIRSSTISRSKTDHQIQTLLQMSKVRVNNSTLDCQPNGKRTKLEHLSINRSHLRKSRIEQFKTYKSKSDSKSRVTCHGSQKLQPISIQKNINSIQQ